MDQKTVHCGQLSPASSAVAVQENTAHARLLPADKALPSDWLARLTGHGESAVLTGDALRYVGMPVSGICTGQVVLSGDGRLCHWDVFKAYGGRADSGDPRGGHYAAPQVPDQPFQIGFALQVGAASPRALDASGFSDVQFEGSYPIGRVMYADPDCAVTVALAAFSPFIPLDTDDSGLPATILEYTVTNVSDQTVRVKLGGWLENAVCPFEPRPQGTRSIDAVKDADGLQLHCSAVLSAPSAIDGQGTMTLALLGRTGAVYPRLTSTGAALIAGLFEGGEGGERHARAALSEQLVGGMRTALTLAPGASETLRFAVAWHFPAYSGGKVFFSTMEDIPDLLNKRRYYASRFRDSRAVVDYLVKHGERLAGLTNLWCATWYDSSLPRWFLDRTFLNVSTLATQTSHRFDDGRFWGWEGVDSCPGTCQHVWQYAQSVAALFPELERDTRERVDLSIAFHPDGSMDYRAEASSHGGQAVTPTERGGEAVLAVDGMAGTIVRILREHKHSADDAFLLRVWPRVRASVELLMRLDRDGDGLIEGPQYNTLDATWYGKLPWISSLYLAALAAGAALARDAGDNAFAQRCEEQLALGRASFVEQLFNGHYFEHRGDPTKPESMDLQQGCYIDQVLGQSFAHQVGLGRILPADVCRSALLSIWRYNFATDVGPYRAGFDGIHGGRWYAMPGEAGVLMCTWPFAPYNATDRKQADIGLGITSEGYLNECMAGFEYQVAAHMLAEGLVYEGLSITRAIHERYAAVKRNPWNEIECGDHYARSMASFGVYQSACGLDYHGPRHTLSIDPKVGPERFRAAVVLSEGWGTYSQQVSGEQGSASLQLRHGKVTLERLRIHAPWAGPQPQVHLHTLAGPVACSVEGHDGWLEIDCGVVLLRAGGDAALFIEINGVAR